MLTGFDHVTVLVQDLDAAVARYGSLLAAAPVWRGEHPELGSRGALFGLSNTLIELTAPHPDADEAEGMRGLLAARGEGLLALAFATDDAAQCSASLRARGLRVTAPQDGEARDAAGHVRSYRTVDLSPRTTRDLTVYVVERPDRATLQRAHAASPDAVTGLDHAVILTADPDAALKLYGEGLGLRLALDRPLGKRRMLFFRSGGVTLEVVEDTGLGASDAFYGLTYRVPDIDAAHARLHAAGFTLDAVRPGMKPGTQVFGVKDGTSGVPTLILRDPSRDAWRPLEVSAGC